MSIFNFNLPSTGIQPSESFTVMRLRIVLVYVGSLSAFFVKPTSGLIALTLIGFYFRAFGAQGGHHRYFAHRSFKTGRIFQFVLACLGASSGQRGPLWWAFFHRAHHRYTDRPLDPHSPIGKGRWYAYLGWLFDKDNDYNRDTNLDSAKDLTRYPELVWVNKYHYLFPYLYLLAVYAIGQWTPLLGGHRGLAAVAWGFFVSTLLSLQGSLMVNAFAHSARTGWFTYRSYRTADSSLNNWLLSLPSLGASWHNNHHHYMNSARAGFRWWELDLTYLTLRVLAMLGLVWDLHEAPSHLVLKQGELDVEAS